MGLKTPVSFIWLISCQQKARFHDWIGLRVLPLAIQSPSTCAVNELRRAARTGAGLGFVVLARRELSPASVL